MSTGVAKALEAAIKKLPAPKELWMSCACAIQLRPDLAGLVCECGGEGVICHVKHGEIRFLCEQHAPG